MKFTIIFIGILITLSCTTVKDGYKSYSVIDKKNHEVVIAFKEGKALLTSKAIPGMRFEGTVDGDDIYFSRVRIFSNWENGWTEGFYQASGKYSVEYSDNGYTLREVDPLEIWDIESGEIRYRDKYYREDDGLQKVRNRIERVKEYSKVIKEGGGPEFLGGVKKPNLLSSYTLKEFFYPILFPEIVGFNKLYKNGDLPDKYYESNNDKLVYEGSNIKWRDDYTRAIYPEHLWELRNSGTIYRDFEEAPNIFISYYNLNGFIEKKLNNIKIIKIED